MKYIGFEKMKMKKIFTDENEEYGLDCSQAIWASDQLHQIYHDAKVQLSDADFMILITICIFWVSENQYITFMWSTMRKRLRGRMKTLLPFSLQESLDTGIKMIDKVDVMSIAEWNNDDIYGKYPFVKLK